MLSVAVVTLFPEMFGAITEFGVGGRAVENGLLRLDLINPRDYTRDRHRTVDDRPYGGGPGMVLMVEPMQTAIRAARERIGGKSRAIYLSPQGRVLDQKGCEELVQTGTLIFVCGRYEGVDERLIAAEIDEEWSIGDYVLSGGELAAMVMIDTLVRLLPGALGHEDSAREDSFVEGLLDCPHYTRPEEVNGLKVPPVLLTGDHEAVRVWRLKQALARTWSRRPELFEALVLNDEQSGLLDEIKKEHRKSIKS